MVLVVLLLGAGAFALVNATSLSSTTSDLNKTRKALVTTETGLSAAQADLANTQTQLNDAQSTLARQGAQLGAYKTCINDVNVAGAALKANNQSAFIAAYRQVEKDCIPLGLG
ncbi:MAG: hypothetical protein M3083_21250 [Actinomycetota bacterium]|nr:hypothetical protein [Actinomycetota bacterium]